MKIMLFPGGDLERELDVEDIEIPDCWDAIQVLKDREETGFAITVGTCWAMAKALLEKLQELSRQGV